jgi:hypothetical protein
MLNNRFKVCFENSSIGCTILFPRIIFYPWEYFFSLLNIYTFFLKSECNFYFSKKNVTFALHLEKSL